MPDTGIQYYGAHGFGTDYIASEANPKTATPTDTGSQPSGMVSRALQYIAGAPFEAAGGLMQGAGNLFNTLTGQPQDTTPIFSPQSQVIPAGPDAGFMQHAVDILGGSILPGALQMAVPEAAVGRVATAFEAAPWLTRVLKSAAGFGALGQAESTKEGIAQALQGAAIGSLGGLPRLERIPLVAAGGAATKAYYDQQAEAQGQPPGSQGNIKAAMNMIFAMLHGGEAPSPPSAQPLPDNFKTLPQLGWGGGQMVYPQEVPGTGGPMPPPYGGELPQPTAPEAQPFATPPALPPAMPSAPEGGGPPTLGAPGTVVAPPYSRGFPPLPAGPEPTPVSKMLGYTTTPADKAGAMYTPYSGGPTIDVQAQVMTPEAAQQLFAPGTNVNPTDVSTTMQNQLLLQRLQDALEGRAPSPPPQSSPLPEGDFNPSKGKMKPFTPYYTSEGGYINGGSGGPEPNIPPDVPTDLQSDTMKALLTRVGLRAAAGAGGGYLYAKSDPTQQMDPLTTALMWGAVAGGGPEVARALMGGLEHLRTPKDLLSENLAEPESYNRPAISAASGGIEPHAGGGAASPSSNLEGFATALSAPESTREATARSYVSDNAPQLSPLLEEAIRQKAALPEGTDTAALYDKGTAEVTPARGEEVAQQLREQQHLFYAGHDTGEATDLEKFMIEKRWGFDHIKYGETMEHPLIDLTTEQAHASDPATSITDPKFIYNKLAEAQLSPGIPDTYSLTELGHTTIDDATTKTLDKKFGKDQWIIKPFTPDTGRSENVWKADEVKAELADNPQAFAPYDTSKMMAQELYNIPKGNPEYRVHVISDPATGKPSVVPYATFTKFKYEAPLSERVPLLYRTPDVEAAEQSALKAVEGLPIEDRSGSAFGVDVTKTADGSWQTVELNPTLSADLTREAGGPEGGGGSISGHMMDNPYVHDAVLSKMAGVTPLAGEVANGIIRPDSKPFATVAKAGEGGGAGKGGGMTAMKPRGSAGFIMPELTAALGRMAIGAIVGGGIGALIDDPGDHKYFTIGAILGTGAGLFGPALAGSIATLLAGKRVIPPLSPKEGWPGFVRNFSANMEDRMGATFSGSDKATDRFVRGLDRAFEMSMPQVVKEALQMAKGLGSVLVAQIDDAMKKMAIRFVPDGVVSDLTNRYLNGELSDTDYMKAMEPHMALDPNNKAFAQFATVGRQSINALQKMVADGIADPKLKKIITDSIGSYLTRSYKLFLDPKWKPDENVITNLVKEMMDKKIWPDATEQDVRSRLNQYIRDVKSGKGAYAGMGDGLGEAISQQALKQRKDLSDAWRQFLGEVTDPRTRIYQTVFRLRPMAEAASYFQDIAKGGIDDTGMPHVFNDYGDYNRFKNQVLQRLQGLDPNDSRVPILNRQLAALKSFQSVDNDLRNGALGGKIVSRHVWDTLKTFESMTDPLDHPWLRSVANLNTFIKLGQTAMNPLRLIRNVWTIPSFMAMSKTGVMDMKNAFDVLRDPNHPLRAELLRQGILNTDQVTSEFYRRFSNLTQNKFNMGSVDLTNLGLGRIDLDMGEKYARYGMGKFMDLYRIPDAAVRTGAYLSAKARIAQALGKSLDDPEVIRTATNYVNRYTMNYDSINPAVKVARQIPLFNMFISYASEMARIGKNITMDVIQGNMNNGVEDLSRNGRMYSMIPLSAMALVPDMMQKASEAQLSPQDQQDWEKTKALMSPEVRNRYRWVTGRDPRTKQFNYIDYTPWLPADTFNQMSKAIQNQDWKGLAAINPVIGWENTPLFNIAVSQSTGTDINTGREFRPARTMEGIGDRLASIARTVLPPWMPGVGSEAVRLQQAYTPDEKGELGVTNLKTGNRITPQDFWSSYVTGLKTGGANLGVLSARTENDMKSEIANEIAYLNDVMKSDVNRDVKARAMQRTQQSLQGIVDLYRAKFSAGQPQSAPATTTSAW